jgi:manganese-transporting P-type ATPase
MSSTKAVSKGLAHPDDKSVVNISLYSPSPLFARLDVLPFAALAAGAASLILFDDYSLVGTILLVLIVIARVFVLMMDYWSVAFRCSMRFTPVASTAVQTATHARVTPPPHAGQPGLCELQRDIGPQGDVEIFFEYHRTKYFFDVEQRVFKEVDYPVAEPLNHYLKSSGLCGDAIAQSERRYGPNVFNIPLPTFGELYKEHAMAPFFVFQIFCVLLWMLDEYWYYSLMTLVMLVMFEGTVVTRRLRHLQMLREMRVPAYPIQVYRDRKWHDLKTDQLLPGDIVTLTRAEQDEHVVPCDMILLRGTCVVNESLLTGESVPQLKEGLDLATPVDQRLDMKETHSCSMVWGGTKVMMTTAPSTPGTIKPRSGGVLAYVMRTGFSTNQGNLVRTILFSTQRVSVNSVESLFFILFLLIFAIAASAYVLVKGLEDPDRSRYKLLLNCIMIITSVVPPELPMELSLAVNTSLMHLTKKKVFCTEPFRIPLAGAVDVCCFDKTGTLTKDEFVVQGIGGLVESKDAQDTPSLTAATVADDRAKWVIGGCHSLTRLSNGEVIGDPLEKAALDAIEWRYADNGVSTGRSVSKSGHSQAHKVKILHRFPFSSALKRMSCVVSLDHETNEHVYAVSKGAPETMESRFATLPSDYKDTHRFFSRQGCRILALGIRQLPKIRTRDAAKIKELVRDEVECKLDFAGFLVLQCPLKEDSKQVIADLLQSSHRVVMITGDHTLTASHVASELGMAAKPVLILTEPDQHLSDSKGAHSNNSDSKFPRKQLQWDSPHGNVSEPFVLADVELLSKSYCLCVSGAAIEFLQVEQGETESSIGLICTYVTVFARVSPQQKEFIITSLKVYGGATTLMCGDGTNDVGALKQAHVGVALIGDASKSPSIASTADDVKSKKKSGVSASQPTHRAAARRGRAVATRAGRGGRAGHAGRPTPMTPMEKMKADLAKMEEESEVKPVRLGDASIASPFTSKTPFITSTVHIIRQGRCTLVTTMQMFHILALNCLISAYCMSVLYLDGVKYGDTQATIAGLGVAMYFLFVSRAEPVEKLSVQRPHSKLFTPYMFLTVLGQFAIHMFCLITAVKWSNPHTPEDEEHRDPEGEFKANVLNTVVFLLSTTMTVATFLANYQGKPFMTSLMKNKPLFRSLILTDVLMMFCALEISPDLNASLELVPLPSEEFRYDLVMIMVLDSLVAIGWAKLMRRLFTIRDGKRTTVNSTAVHPVAPQFQSKTGTTAHLHNE